MSESNAAPPGYTSPPLYDEAATISTYHPHFSEPEADTVLRSSDGTLFCVYASTLHTASRVLGNMIDAHTGGGVLDKKGKIIELEETAQVMERFLRIVAGMEFLPWETRQDIWDMVHVAEKYDAPAVTSVVQLLLGSSLLQSSPLEMYAIACRLAAKKEIQQASILSLKLDFEDGEVRSLLSFIPVPNLLDLLALRNRRIRQFRHHFLSEDAPTHYSMSCGHTASYHFIPRAVLVDVLSEMDRRPLGDTVLTAMEKPELQNKFHLRCSICRRSVSMKNGLHFRFKVIIDNLSDTLLD